MPPLSTTNVSPWRARAPARARTGSLGPRAGASHGSTVEAVGGIGSTAGRRSIDRLIAPARVPRQGVRGSPERTGASRRRGRTGLRGGDHDTRRGGGIARAVEAGTAALLDAELEVEWAGVARRRHPKLLREPLAGRHVSPQ